jgi:hypothetical protein
MSVHLKFIATSGNIATPVVYAHNAAIAVEVGWKDDPSAQDCDEFWEWWMKLMGDSVNQNTAK